MFRIATLAAFGLLITLLSPGSADALCSIDCFLFPNLSCFCGQVQTCTDTRECKSGEFNGWNDPSNVRTGVKLCGLQSGTTTVEFELEGSTAEGTVTGTGCNQFHLDELTWDPSEPTVPVPVPKTVTFTVKDNKKVSILRSLTSDGTNYGVAKVQICNE